MLQAIAACGGVGSDPGGRQGARPPAAFEGSLLPVSTAHDAARLPVSVCDADPVDMADVIELVRNARLPLDGLRDAAVILVAKVEGRVVGTVALERHGSGTQLAFLLRSAVVDPAWRGQGIGAALTSAALENVDAAGAQVGLLTETAERYFLRFGFVPVSRGDLPAVLKGSPELRDACPASAHTLLRAPVGAVAGGTRTAPAVGYDEDRGAPNPGRAVSPGASWDEALRRSAQAAHSRARDLVCSRRRARPPGCAGIHQRIFGHYLPFID